MHYINGSFGYSPDESVGYKAEIVARLRAYDKLKESIEKLIATMSNEVDK